MKNETKYFINGYYKASGNMTGCWTGGDFTSIKECRSFASYLRKQNPMERFEIIKAITVFTEIK